MLLSASCLPPCTPGAALPAPLVWRRSRAGASIICIDEEDDEPSTPASAFADVDDARGASAAALSAACALGRGSEADVALALLSAGAAGLRPAALAAVAAVATAARGAPVTAPGAALQLQENYSLRQFWTHEVTALALADEALRLASRAAPRAVRVACLSCPSVFKALQERLRAAGAGAGGQLVAPLLFEFDRRFAAFGAAFRRWDCAAPVASLAGCGALGAVDIFAADPPYLTRDCLAAFGEAMAALRAAPGAPLLLCTGAALEADAREVLGCRRTRFAVRHAGGLANPFALFVNYEGGAAAGPMGGWADEAP